MAATRAIPIIICGRTSAIGEAVMAGIQPEYKTVAFIKSTEQGIKEIPPLLESKKASAVVAGGGYDDAAIKEMRAAVTQGGKDVPWLRADTSESMPPVGPEYGKKMVLRVKEKLDEVFGKGRGVDGGIYWY